MRRFVVLAAVFSACSSPEVCDQTVVADIANMSAHHADLPSTGAAFTCAGGGSGYGDNVQGSIWSETITYDNCTENVGDDTLTLTGTIMLGGDTINNPINDHGDADMFTIRGTVAGCGNVDETCTVHWGPKQDANDANFYRSGTLCGRSFP